MPKRSDAFVRDIKKISRLTSAPVKASIALIISGFLAGVAYEEFVGIGTWHSYAQKTEAINICFTPPSGCGALIIQQISKAEKSIHVQAFNFYSDPIANALIKAKLRGVKVRVILDKTNNYNEKSQASLLMKEGIEVVIDSSPGIAHNKIIIIDQVKVITGSFNFSDSADTKNAENVVLLVDKYIAKSYLENWENRYACARKIK